jgi:hypothetical protein
MDTELTVEEAGHNVVFLPTMIKNGNKITKPAEEDLTADDYKKIALDKIQKMGETASSVFTLLIDKETGNPTIVMGGSTDITFLNMFLDCLKDELKATFMGGLIMSHNGINADGESDGQW